MDTTDTALLEASSTSVEGAKRHIRNRIKELEDSCVELELATQEHQSVLELLGTLPSALTHSIIVPLGRHAFFRGELIHTNEVFMRLSESYFLHRTAPNTMKSIEARKQFFESKLKDAAEALHLLRLEANLATELQTDAPQSGTPTQPYIVEPNTLQTSKEQTTSAVSIHKTAEGFLEIREAYTSDEEDEKRLHEVDQPQPQNSDKQDAAHPPAPTFQISHAAGSSEPSKASSREEDPEAEANIKSITSTRTMGKEPPKSETVRRKSLFMQSKEKKKEH